MSDAPKREMTLDEFVATLGPFHRAVQELADLKERAATDALTAELVVVDFEPEGSPDKVTLTFEIPASTPRKFGPGTWLLSEQRRTLPTGRRSPNGEVK